MRGTNKSAFLANGEGEEDESVTIIQKRNIPWKKIEIARRVAPAGNGAFPAFAFLSQASQKLAIASREERFSGESKESSSAHT